MPTYSGRPGNTATRRRAIARDARRFGHFRPSQGLAYVYCPRCGKRVDADVSVGETVTHALDAFVIVHLEDCLDYPDA